MYYLSYNSAILLQVYFSHLPASYKKYFEELSKLAYSWIHCKAISANEKTDNEETKEKEEKEEACCKPCKYHAAPLIR